MAKPRPKIPAAAGRSKRVARATTVSSKNRDDASEEIEGDEVPEGIEKYPLDDLLIRTESRAIQDVLRRIRNKQIDLDPEFQRAFLWDEKVQSKLVESVLMRIPLQVFYFAENEDGNLVVVDGLQRLTTFQRFYDGLLALDLEARDQLHKKKYSQIDPKLQIRFEDGQLTFYIISSKVPERVRLDIFERVNGGTPLTRQQMRHAIHNGESTRLLSELANLPSFKSATGGALGGEDKVRQMKDREAINRFLAYLHLGWTEYLNYDDFLARALRETNDRLKGGVVVEDRSGVRDKIKSAFSISMELNQQLFGDHAFRKSMIQSTGRRSALNLALFDVFSTGLARYPRQSVLAKSKNIRAAITKLLNNKRFKDSISFATAEASNVQTRFEMTGKMLAEVLGAPIN